MTTWIWEWLSRQSGQGLIEYAAVVGVLALALATATAAGLLDGAIAAFFTDLGECVVWGGDDCP